MQYRFFRPVSHSTALIAALLAWLVLVSVAPAAQTATSPPGRTAPPPAARPSGKDDSRTDRLELGARARLGEIRAKIATAERPEVLVAELQPLFDLCIAYGGPVKHADLLRDISSLLRLFMSMSQLPPGQAKASLAWIAANPANAATLGMTLARQDDPAKVFEVLGRIVAKFPAETSDPKPGPGKRDEGLGSLLAAVCVVHDRPFSRPKIRPDEAAMVVDPVEVFGYFAANRRSLIYDLAESAPDALIHVVNTQASPAELEWALGFYKGNALIGKVYHSITYDNQHFRMGKPKRITETDGFTLKNLQKVGGVCVEQAYFAAHVGKAIGVPTASVVGRGASMGHAWVGYVKGERGQRRWDMSEGRYEEYESLGGEIQDPQTGETISDAELSMTAYSIRAARADREGALALTDAARALSEARRLQSPFPPEFPGDWGAPPRSPRRAVESEELALLREAVNRNPGCMPAWRQVLERAQRGELDAQAKTQWQDAIIELCAHDEPAFALEVVGALIRTLNSPTEQDKRWEWAAKRFTRRPDLVAVARFEQAQVWNTAGEPDKALNLYRDVVKRFPNTGPAAVEALREIEMLMRSRNVRVGEIVKQYEDAFRRIKKPAPASGTYNGQSNYVRVGRRLAALLNEAGQVRDAEQVSEQVNAAIN